MELLRNAFTERDALHRERLAGAAAIFLDYDGTLTPIVNDPDKAILTEESRAVLRRVGTAYPVGVVSGRSCDKLQNFLQIEQMVIAGSHGLDIRMPDGRAMLHPIGEKARAPLQRVMEQLSSELADIPGYLTEDNVLCVSAHYRMVAPEQQPRVHAAVEAVLLNEPALKHKEGKMVHELRPAVDWAKGQAVEWLLDAFRDARAADAPGLIPLYIGDDVADEDAFRFVEAHGGVGIKVADTPVTAADTAASWQLTQEQVIPLLEALLS